MPGMTAHPMPFDLVGAAARSKRCHRSTFFTCSLLAVRQPRLPSWKPPRDAVAQILAVGKADSARPLQRFQPGDAAISSMRLFVVAGSRPTTLRCRAIAERCPTCRARDCRCCRPIGEDFNFRHRCHTPPGPRCHGENAAS
jgi:hypothetical protein